MGCDGDSACAAAVALWLAAQGRPAVAFCPGLLSSASAAASQAGGSADNSSSSPASSSTLTPSSSAFSSLEPASSPATT
jgi:hypothetical protein